MIKKTLFCDVCLQEMKERGISALDPLSRDTVDRIQVIFETEQTEGRTTKPYLSEEKIDICQKCLDKVLDGNYLHATGAMGHNNYYFKKNE